MTFRYDALDISQEQLPLLKEWVKMLEDEELVGGGGITVPIKQELVEGQDTCYYDEWQPSENWGD